MERSRLYIWNRLHLILSIGLTFSLITITLYIIIAYIIGRRSKGKGRHVYSGCEWNQEVGVRRQEFRNRICYQEEVQGF